MRGPRTRQQHLFVALIGVSALSVSAFPPLPVTSPIPLELKGYSGRVIPSNTLESAYVLAY
jgi:hypothetical protein